MTQEQLWDLFQAKMVEEGMDLPAFVAWARAQPCPPSRELLAQLVEEATGATLRGIAAMVEAHGELACLAQERVQEAEEKRRRCLEALGVDPTCEHGAVPSGCDMVPGDGSRGRARRDRTKG